MMKEQDFQDKLNKLSDLKPSDSTVDTSKKTFPDWNRIYSEMKVEEMPWYLPELDPDLKETLHDLNIVSGNFLDLGTGPGTQAIELTEMGFDVTGIDISFDAIKNAKKTNNRVKFIQDDILNSHINQQFDFIFDRGCFHIIDEDKRTSYISQIAKNLSKEGLFLLKCFSDKNTVTGFGPYHISRTLIKELFGKQFNILQIKDSVYQSTSSQQNKTLFVVMKKKVE